MRAAAALLTVLACASLGSAGCSLDYTPDMTTTGNNQQLGDGRLFITWTVGGATPDLIGCGTIDHLSLKLDYRSGFGVKVEPIPCKLDRFRYDNLPTGDAQAVLTGFDTDGCIVASGRASLTLTSTLPDAPSPTVPIEAPHACR